MKGFKDHYGQEVNVGDFIVATDNGRSRIYQVTKFSKKGNLVCRLGIYRTGMEGKSVMLGTMRIISPFSSHTFVKIPVNQEWIDNVIAQSKV